jgi:hypothetical protein
MSQIILTDVDAPLTPPADSSTELFTPDEQLEETEKVDLFAPKRPPMFFQLAITNWKDNFLVLLTPTRRDEEGKPAAYILQHGDTIAAPGEYSRLMCENALSNALPELNLIFVVQSPCPKAEARELATDSVNNYPHPETGAPAVQWMKRKTRRELIRKMEKEILPAVMAAPV